jgi:hypothetical protein
VDALFGRVKKHKLQQSQDAACLIAGGIFYAFRQGAIGDCGGVVALSSESSLSISGKIISLRCINV